MSAIKILFLVSIQGAWSQSIKSCGGPNDHLRNPSIKLTPDPIVKDGTLTIDVSGTLDEDMSVASSNVDLKIKALGIVSASVKGNLPMSISPAAPKGDFSLTVGPMQLPSVPGHTEITGQVHVVNDKSEPIACIDINLDVSSIQSSRIPALSVGESTSVESISSCGKPTDHIPDFSVATSSEGAITMTGTLDEPVMKSSIELDASIKVLFVSIPLKMNIPIAITPGEPKGPIKAVIGPSSIAVSPDVKATLKGTAVIKDAKGDEITCVNMDTVISGYKYDFPAYLKQFGKSYLGDEYQRRQTIFEANMAKISAHNDEYNSGKHTWFAAVNEFVDATEEEFAKLRSTKYSPSHHPLVDLTAEQNTPNPDSIDWREKGAVTAVKNQGGCGSCWAFSATESLESHFQIATGKLVELAPQTFVNCVKNPNQCGGKGGCEGATMELAFNLTKATGIALESDMPYAGRDEQCRSYKPAVKCTGYVKNPVNSAIGLETALATKGPVSVTVAAGSWAFYGGGIFHGCSKGFLGHADATLDHGVQAVGYTKDYWIVRNSWGPTWGEKGFIRIQRATDQQTFTDENPTDGVACKPYPKTQVVGGECGILFDTSYPIGVTASMDEVIV